MTTDSRAPRTAAGRNVAADDLRAAIRNLREGKYGMLADLDQALIFAYNYGRAEAAADPVAEEALRLREALTDVLPFVRVGPGPLGDDPASKAFGEQPPATSSLEAVGVVPHREDDQPCGCDVCMEYAAEDDGVRWEALSPAKQLVVRILGSGDDRFAEIAAAIREWEETA